MAKVLKNRHHNSHKIVIKDLKILFRWRDPAGLKLFLLERGDLEKHGETFAGPSKLEIQNIFTIFSIFLPLIGKLKI
jgi:hypothetical protein